jgi:hypothetical protein
VAKWLWKKVVEGISIPNGIFFDRKISLNIG